MTRRTAAALTGGLFATAAALLLAVAGIRVFAEADAASPEPAKAVNWEEVLGPPQGSLPPPRAAAEPVDVPSFRQVSAKSKTVWESDIHEGLKGARAENRP